MNKSKDITSVLKSMKIGKSEVFPIARHNSIRVTCSNYSIIYDGKFTVSLNRIDGTVKVTRVE
jgi:hypothetical protein